jgi:recombination protein RecT
MNQVVVKKTEIETVRAAIDRMKPQMALAMPKHLTPERLLRVTMTCIQNTPKLLECDRNSLFAAVMTCAQLGLEPDGMLGQAYLVPFGGKVQFIPGYRGLLSLARNSGEVETISAHEVREKDFFEFEFGLDEKCVHRPARGDRGPITHFYACAKFKDGGKYFDVMTAEEVDTIRDNSQGYKSAKRFAKDGVINSPWVTNYVEMGRKTAIRRIVKYLPLSVQKAMAISDSYDAGRSAVMGSAGELVIDSVASEVVDIPPAEVDQKKAALDEFEASPPPAVECEGQNHDPH